LDPDFATTLFVGWLRQRAAERRTRAGATVGWHAFEREQPALAQAALRFLHAYELAPPDGVRLGERHRQPPTAADWTVLIQDFALRCLKPSDAPEDAAAWEEIRRALPPLGYVLTAAGVRRHVSPLDRVLALSASKGVAATEILRVESEAIGPRLRALL